MTKKTYYAKIQLPAMLLPLPLRAGQPHEFELRPRMPFTYAQEAYTMDQARVLILDTLYRLGFMAVEIMMSDQPIEGLPTE